MMNMLLRANIFLFLVMLAMPGWAADKIGVIGVANPEVSARTAEGSQRGLTVGGAIYFRDTVMTSAQGNAQLLFVDKSALTVGPGSEVMIDEFVYDPVTSSGKMVANGVKGVFRFIGGALSKKEAVKIKTPVSTIGIRGGIALVEIAPDGATQATFVYGEQMEVQGANGDVQVTTVPGSGITVPDRYTPPTVPVKVDTGTLNRKMMKLRAQPGTTGGARQQPTRQDVNKSLVKAGDKQDKNADKQENSSQDSTSGKPKKDEGDTGNANGQKRDREQSGEQQGNREEGSKPDNTADNTGGNSSYNGEREGNPSAKPNAEGPYGDGAGKPGNEFSGVPNAPEPGQKDGATTGFAGTGNLFEQRADFLGGLETTTLTGDETRDSQREQELRCQFILNGQCVTVDATGRLPNGNCVDPSKGCGQGGTTGGGIDTTTDTTTTTCQHTLNGQCVTADASGHLPNGVCVVPSLCDPGTQQPDPEDEEEEVADTTTTTSGSSSGGNPAGNDDDPSATDLLAEHSSHTLPSEFTDIIDPSTNAIDTGKTPGELIRGEDINTIYSEYFPNGSAFLTSGGKLPTCTQCEFVDWAAWNEGFGDGNDAVYEVNETTGKGVFNAERMDLFVVGQLTTPEQLDATDVRSLGEVTYTGPMLGNVSGAVSRFATGEFSTVIDLDDRKLRSFAVEIDTFNFSFNEALVELDDGAFEVDVNAMDVTSQGTPLKSTGTNIIRGRLYGDAAQEVGGGFTLEGVGNRQIDGVYVGRR